MSRKVAPKTAVRPMPAGKHSDERMVALFLDMLAAERGAGKNTLAAYGRDLADFADYLAGGRTVATAATDDIRGYLGDLTKRGMQPATVARRLSAIRQLYRFLYAEGQRKDDPAAVLETALGPLASRQTRQAVARAESKAQAMTFVQMAPEFLRR